MTIVPRRWHIYVVDLEPRVATKPGKRRPCLAIQPDEFAQGGLGSTAVLPLTTRLTQRDAFPLRIRIPRGSCGLNADSDLLVDQVLAWDNALFRREVGVLPEALQDEVRSALREFLDL